MTGRFENDRVEISVEVNETDNIHDAILLAKETCKKALQVVGEQEKSERARLRELAERYPDEID